jgi:sodium/potassium/calcium exchanger 6
LAFGNGSPDVFSTFSAMRANSGVLAIGELIGAATFIVSCVVGSMCIIKPFEVHRLPFLRDVGFFTLAVGLVLVILWDGQISAWEAGTLVLLYVVYVAVVVGGSLSDRKKRDDLHNHLRVSVSQEPYFDERKSTTGLFTVALMCSAAPLSPGRVRAVSAPDLPRLDVHNLTHHSQPPSPTSSHVAQLPSFSLVGALEFRDVVASLQKQAAGPSLGIFDSPVAPYAGGHYHTRFARSRSASPQSSMDEETLIGLQRTRSPVASRPSSDTRTEPRDMPSVDPQDYFSTNIPTRPIPPILRTPASPQDSTSDASSIEPLYTPPDNSSGLLGVLGQAYHILFPTLHNFRQQTALSQVACVLAAPAVLCLTLTLPVVVTPYENGRAAPEKMYNTDTRLAEFEEEGVERTLFAEQEVQDNLHQLSFNKWLMAAQCVFGPLFCAKVLFGGY